MKIKLLCLAMIVALCAGCGNKMGRTYELRCPQADGHPNCGQTYDSFSECNSARHEHDRDVDDAGKYPASCY